MPILTDDRRTELRATIAHLQEWTDKADTQTARDLYAIDSILAAIEGVYYDEEDEQD